MDGSRRAASKLEGRAILTKAHPDGSQRLTRQSHGPTRRTQRPLADVVEGKRLLQDVRRIVQTSGAEGAASMATGGSATGMGGACFKGKGTREKGQRWVDGERNDSYRKCRWVTTIRRSAVSEGPDRALSGRGGTDAAVPVHRLAQAVLEAHDRPIAEQLARLGNVGLRVADVPGS
jgi:hypothetical protein